MPRQPHPDEAPATAASATRIAAASAVRALGTKGTSIASVIGYARKIGGEEGVVRLAAAARSPSAGLLPAEMILRGSWYPFADFVSLLEAGDAAFPDVASFAYRQGAFGADTDLRGVYRAFVRLASPRFLVERASTVWKQYYTSGELRIIESTPMHVGFELLGFARPHTLHCDAVLGWCTRAAELTGVTGVRGQHPSCRARGAARCRFAIDWTCSAWRGTPRGRECFSSDARETATEQRAARSPD